MLQQPAAIDRLMSTAASVPDKIVLASEKRNFTVAEFMSAYGISRTRLYREINEGRLVARRIGGRTMVARDDAEAWLAALPVHRPALKLAA